ncbi:MAG: serpin family protein [Pseudonocardiaceae bacterium]
MTGSRMQKIRCVGAIVFDGGGRLLLVRRTNEPGRGRWSVPGGRVAASETDQHAVIREVAEETGLDVEITRRVGGVQRCAPGGAVFDIHDYLCRATGGTLRAGDDADDARWCDRETLASLPIVDGLVDALTGWGCLPAGGGDGVLSAQGVPREVPRHAPVEQTVAGLTKFGHDLYTVAGAPAKNTVISPLSIGYAFGMARAGAAGQTAGQLDQVFGFPASGPHSALNELDQWIGTVGELPRRRPPDSTRAPGEHPAPPVVAIANGLFIQGGLPVADGFLRTLASQYGAGARIFSSGRGTEQINAWVRAQTADRIDRLFDQLDPATRLVLANAVYLKADWQTPFTKNPTMDATFTRADGATVAVPMMHQRESLRYASSQAWQAVELPYAESELAMRVIVPQGELTPAEVLSPETLTQVEARLQAGQVELFLPRWDFATDLDLLPALNTLGLTALDDFSAMSQERLALDQAVHRANITVDEWGTEAAAVTGLVFLVSAPPQPQFVVHADRPFAFVVVHQPTGAPLFIGHVADPLAR